MVFKCEFAVKLHAKDVKVWISSDRNPRKDQVTKGRVHSPGSTNDKRLSFVIVPLLNPSQVHVHRGSNSRSVCWLADNSTPSSVESPAWAYSLFSTSANISRVYRINRKGPNSLPCGTHETNGIHSLVAPSNTTLCLRSERNSATYTNRFQFSIEVDFYCTVNI